jgi:hypothetical protein
MVQDSPLRRDTHLSPGSNPTIHSFFLALGGRGVYPKTQSPKPIKFFVSFLQKMSFLDPNTHSPLTHRSPHKRPFSTLQTNNKQSLSSLQPPLSNLHSPTTSLHSFSTLQTNHLSPLSKHTTNNHSPFPQQTNKTTTTLHTIHTSDEVFGTLSTHQDTIPRPSSLPLPLHGQPEPGLIL